MLPQALFCAEECVLITDNHFTHTLVGQIYLEMKEFSLALQYFFNAVQLCPSFKTAILLFQSTVDKVKQTKNVTEMRKLIK